MSAICGILHRDDQPIDPQHVETVLQTQAPSGLDRVGTWCSHRVALGQQTHVSLPAAPQEPLPWRDAAAGLTVAADVRLDNRHELCAALSIPPSEREAVSDRQLLLCAYQKWGLDCPAHLLGDFAVIIWDAAQQRLFGARDIAGVRPFYYHLSPQRFAVASDMLALMALPGMPGGIDDAYVAEQYFSPRPNPAIEATFYAAVRCLPPAHAMVVDAETSRIWQWWSPDQVPSGRCRSMKAYADELRELLQQAVNCRLRSAVPVGAHLSGGLNASSVAVTAARALRERGQTLPVFFWAARGDPAAYDAEDERVWVSEICQRENLTCHDLEMTAWEAAHWHLRSAGDRNAGLSFRTRAVHRLAQAEGVGVLLSGLGGDRGISFFANRYGYEYLFRHHAWWALWRQSRHLAKQSGDIGIRRWWYLVQRTRERWTAPRRRLRFPRRQRGPNPCLQPEFAARYSPRERPTGITAPTVRAAQVELLLSHQLQEQLVGWAAEGAVSGIDYRYPLLDRRLIEFALGLPAVVLGRHGWDRYLFRYAMQDRLPAGACWQWRMQKRAVYMDGQRISSDFDTEIFIPLMDTLLAQDWPWQVLRPEGVFQCRGRRRPSWPEALEALRLEMFFNANLEAAVLSQLQAMQGT